MGSLGPQAPDIPLPALTPGPSSLKVERLSGGENKTLFVGSVGMVMWSCAFIPPLEKKAGHLEAEVTASPKENVLRAASLPLSLIQDVIDCYFPGSMLWSCPAS